ncbi:hypothetical protein [Rossellomorea marisflavi]|uniref:hypothetical protein n=1 Tax=Rossellomorea marisflavi TaxID=189381 RepID=UPI003F9F9A10
MAQALTVKEIIAEEMKFGHQLLRLNHTPSKGVAVELDVELDYLPELHESAELMSATQQNGRDIIFKYLEDMIQLLPEVKAEGVMEKGVFGVLETLLLSLDYLTHERLLNAPYTAQIAEDLDAIYAQAFEQEKTAVFSTDANRPRNNRGKIYERDGALYVDDQREENRNFIYMAVIYKKPDNLMERMKQLGYWMGNVNLNPSTDKVSYEEMCEGKTNHEIHERTLFYLNTTLKTLSWFLNSTSWRSNELHGFDQMDIASKLGLYR